MIKVFLLILEPGATWDKIAQAKRGFWHITLVHLLPLIVLNTALEAWGLRLHGKWQSQFHRFRDFTREEAITFGITDFLLLVAMVFVTAVLVFKISQTFHGRLTRLQVFTTVAYGFSPVFLVGVFNFFATMHPAVTWLVGTGLTMWILYQGIPRVMQPDPTHAFGVYLSSVMVVLLTSGLARLMTAMYVLGYMDLKNSWLSHKISHLLGQ